jgi:hypothetical protein
MLAVFSQKVSEGESLQGSGFDGDLESGMSHALAEGMSLEW